MNKIQQDIISPVQISEMRLFQLYNNLLSLSKCLSKIIQRIRLIKKKSTNQSVSRQLFD